MENTEKKSLPELIRSWVPVIALIIGLLALRWTLVEPYVVPTGSMEPTLKPGDRLYALKCSYDIRFPFTEMILFRIRAPQRGDVILFRAPTSPDITYVKRAVAIPGDRIAIRDGALYVNGEVVPWEVQSNRDLMYDLDFKDDKTLYIETLTGVRHWAILDNQRPNNRFRDEIVVPPDHYFAVGDNRDNSHDSRAWGFVPYENLKGKAMIIWFSAADKTDRRPPEPASGIGLIVQMLRDFVVFSVRLVSGDAYIRTERIGTLIQ